MSPPEITKPSRGASRAEWKRYAQSRLPRDGCVFARNRHVTAHYARLYLDHPSCFKWAGMAAYASHHIRLALLPLRVGTDGEGCRVVDPHELSSPRLSFGDIELLRSINEGIFDDIYWAHVVYGGKEEGLAELARLAGPQDRELLRGFETIERGRVISEVATTPERRAEGRELIWQGNRGLLFHEQTALVQPKFARLSTAFAHAFSAASTLGFSRSGEPLPRMRLFCSFYLHMVREGVWRRGRTFSIPMITRFEDRWDWIEGCILPCFRAFEDDSVSPIRSQLAEMSAVLDEA